MQLQPDQENSHRLRRLRRPIGNENRLNERVEQTFGDDSDVARDGVGVTLGTVGDVDDVIVATAQVQERQNVAEDLGARSDFFPLELKLEKWGLLRMRVRKCDNF